MVAAAIRDVLRAAHEALMDALPPPPQLFIGSVERQNKEKQKFSANWGG